MGKKSRLKRMRRKVRHESDAQLELHQFKHPFADIPFDQLRKGLAEVGRVQAAKYSESTAKIQELISAADPRCLIASLAAYGLSVAVKHDGTSSSLSKREVIPAHVELAQALCLRHGIERHAHAPALGATVQATFDTLAQWSDQFLAKRFVNIESAATDVERKRMYVQERIRIATQAVRNWGFYDQMKQVAIDIMTPLEDRFERVNGFRARVLVDSFDYCFGEVQRRLNEHIGRVRRMLGAGDLRQAIGEYYAAFPDLKGTADNFLALMRERRVDLKTAKSMLMSHADLRLPDVFTFRPEDIAKSTSHTSETVVRALDAVSHRFGDLKDTKIEFFFLNNPVWTRPAIRLDDGAYFCVMPQTFLAFWFETILRLVRCDETLRIAYDDRRSDYLEKRTMAVFSSALPGATLVANFIWRATDRSVQYESDLLVKIDSFLVIVEAKAGRVSPESRRGAPDRLGGDIDSLLVQPSRQSQRLSDAISAAQRGEPGTEEFLNTFPVDLKSIHRVIRLSITLDDIGFLQTNVTALKESGYVPEELQMAPAVTLTDLEIVFDILESAPERIHYWVRRGEWEDRADYMADEIDLLGVYLKTGLDLGELEFGNAHLVLVGESKLIDEYYETTRHGIVADKPRYHATPWWRDILRRMQERKPFRWIEAAVVMLCAGYQQQMEIERRTKSIVADVEKRREAAKSRNALIFLPAKGRAEAVCVLVLVNSQMADRHKLMENVSAQAFQSHAAVEQCAVIVLDVDGQIYPYSTLGWFTKPIPQE